jgi:hypothetical protein
MKLNRGEPDHPYWRTPFTPKEKAVAWLGLGACFLVLGIMDWVNPPSPPFTGRWSWLTSWAYGALGAHGPATLYFLIGALFVIAGGLHFARRGGEGNAR